MKVILIEDVKTLGKKGDTVNVNDGYARNFILPKKLGIEATAKNINDLKLQKANEEKVAKEILEAAKAFAEDIKEKSVTVTIKTGEGGKTFGSVSSKEIAAAYKSQLNIEIDKKKLQLAEPVRSLGVYKVPYKVHPKVTAELTVKVTYAYEAQNMDEAIIKKIMPHSIDSEKAVIGSMIMDADAIVAASEMLTGDDFYQRQFGILFETMVELYNEGKPVDVLTLQERLKMKDVPEEFASIEYISELVDSVPISTNIRQYAQTVADDAMLRRLIRVNEEIANACYQHKESVEEIMNTTEKRIFDVIQKKSTDEYVPIQDVVLSVIDKIEAAARHKGTVTGLATGFYDLDYKTSGLQPSDLILIAARPSMGKTAFVLNLAQYMCVRNHVPTAIFSLEMSKDQLVNRILSMESKVDSQSMRTGTLQPADWEKLIESAGVISTAPLIIDDTPGISITELRSKCRKYKLENDLGLVIIDYLQLMTGGSKKQESRQQEISEISRSLKALAREINAPVIALSQLSRACETRPDHRPMLSDLRESGAIEQDADVVMFLYRDDYYNKDTDKKNISEVIIAKQRNGPIGTVELVWLPNYTKFANKEK